MQINMTKRYPMEIQFFNDPKGGYYFGYFVDFGCTACSATGKTSDELFRNLDRVGARVVYHLEQTGRPVPAPSNIRCFAIKVKSIDSDFAELVNDNFWDLI